MGWFDKKYCDICGEKIGLFGNRKLEDGNMCKTCAKKLSPWFTERRHTDLAGIKEQLAYREDNKKAVREFNITYELGEKMKVLVDEDAGTFMVTDREDLEEANPDVIDLAQVTDCKLDVSSYRNEMYHTTKDGEQESYNPPRYEYHYDFYIEIRVDHPYIDEIRFKLNKSTLEIEYSDNSFFGFGSLDPERDSEYRYYQETANEIIDTLMGNYEEDCEEEYEDGPEEERMVVCPYCGSRCRAEGSGRCEYCGGQLEI